MLATANTSTNVDHAQLVAGYAELLEGDVFGDGVIFAVAFALAHGLQRGSPVILGPPDIDIVVPANSPIEEAIDLAQLCVEIGTLQAVEQSEPLFKNAEPRATIERLHAVAQPGAVDARCK